MTKNPTSHSIEQKVKTLVSYNSFVPEESGAGVVNVDELRTALTTVAQEARESELEILAVHLDRQLAGYTSVSVDSVYRYIEKRKEALSHTDDKTST